MSPVAWQMQNKSAVALAKVPYRDSSQQTVDRALRGALDRLGGIRRFVAEGQVVAIVPDQSTPQTSTAGVTTSVQMVSALVRCCLEAGAREVLVAATALQGLSTRASMKSTGMASAAVDAGARVVYLDEFSRAAVDLGAEHPAGCTDVPEVLERVDVFIDCPKAKTHYLDLIGGACWNFAGLASALAEESGCGSDCTYCDYRAQLIRRYRPALTVCDGMVAGEGQGPTGCSPFWWGFILASDDPVAADLTLARLFGLDWRQLKLPERAADIGVGYFDPDKIEIKGTPIEDAAVQVEPSEPGMHVYPCRTIVGTGAGIALEGTLGHWKELADFWLEDGSWTLINRLGTSTFMFGDADDPLFEQHLREGPYVVLGDSAQERYKNDPRVIFLPGSPVPRTYILFDMVSGLGFEGAYEPGSRLRPVISGTRPTLAGAGAGKSKVPAILKGVAAAVAVAAAVPVVSQYASRRRERGSNE